MDVKMKTKTQKQKQNSMLNKALKEKQYRTWSTCLPPIFSFKTEQSRPLYLLRSKNSPADSIATHWDCDA